MPTDIVVRKGLNLKLTGEAVLETEGPKKSSDYSVYPSDFHGIYPKLLVKENDPVKAGDILFYDKNSEKVKFASPVSGKIHEIVRGERRRVLEIKIKSDGKNSYRKLSKVSNSDPTKIVDFLLDSGLWSFVKQRPYDIIADPGSNPKEIYISGFDSAPLSADYDYVTAEEKKNITTAIDYLCKLTDGSVNVSLRKESKSFLRELSNINICNVRGPHPSGNLSTIINKTSPINKGDVVWTLNLPDLVIIGNAILNGKYNAERIIAISGSSVESPKYFKTKIGSSISSFLKIKHENSRIISGNILSGTKLGPSGHLRH